MYLLTNVFSEDYTVINTNGVDLFRDFSMTVPHQTHLVFKVQACKSVYVLLATSFNRDHKVLVLLPIINVTNSGMMMNALVEY